MRSNAGGLDSSEHRAAPALPWPRLTSGPCLQPLVHLTDAGNLHGSVLPDGDPRQEPGHLALGLCCLPTTPSHPGFGHGAVLTVLVQLLHARRGLVNFTSWFLDQLR